jgi:hypothetical protein
VRAWARALGDAAPGDGEGLPVLAEGRKRAQLVGVYMCMSDVTGWVHTGVCVMPQHIYFSNVQIGTPDTGLCVAYGARCVACVLR